LTARREKTSGISLRGARHGEGWEKKKKSCRLTDQKLEITTKPQGNFFTRGGGCTTGTNNQLGDAGRAGRGGGKKLESKKKPFATHAGRGGGAKREVKLRKKPTKVEVVQSRKDGRKKTENQ